MSAVLETVALFGPAERNYVFTHAVWDVGGHPIDWVIAGRILWVAERRRASLLVVRLTCGEEQLRERISTEERRARFKTTDAFWLSLSTTSAVSERSPPSEPVMR